MNVRLDTVGIDLFVTTWSNDSIVVGLHPGASYFGSLLNTHTMDPVQ